MPAAIAACNTKHAAAPPLIPTPAPSQGSRALPCLSLVPENPSGGARQRTVWRCGSWFLHSTDRTRFHGDASFPGRQGHKPGFPGGRGFHRPSNGFLRLLRVEAAPGPKARLGRNQNPPRRLIHGRAVSASGGARPASRPGSESPSTLCPPALRLAGDSVSHCSALRSGFALTSPFCVRNPGLVPPGGGGESGRFGLPGRSREFCLVKCINV